MVEGREEEATDNRVVRSEAETSRSVAVGGGQGESTVERYESSPIAVNVPLALLHHPCCRVGVPPAVPAESNRPL